MIRSLLRPYQRRVSRLAQRRAVIDPSLGGNLVIKTWRSKRTCVMIPAKGRPPFRSLEASLPCRESLGVWGQWNCLGLSKFQASCRKAHNTI